MKNSLLCALSASAVNYPKTRPPPPLSRAARGRIEGSGRLRIKHALRVNRLQEPIRRYFTPDFRFSRARQDFAPYGGKLQAEADIIAKTADRLLLDAAGMLAVHKL